MRTLVSRRHFLRSAGAGVAAGLAGSSAAAVAHGSQIAASLTPDEALAALVAGNRRWVNSRLRHPHQSIARREELAHHQHPFATVFSCIDSRVPPEVVFDRGIGDMIVARTGAQVLDQGIVLGSIEFSVTKLHTPLILVMGHQRCGAVEAAIEHIRAGTTAPGHIQAVVDALRPAYDAASKEGDIVTNTVQEQTKLIVRQIAMDPLIAPTIERGETKVVGGYYALDTGAVSIIA